MSNSNTRPAHTVKGFRTSFTRNCLSNALAFMVESMLDGNINTGANRVSILVMTYYGAGSMWIGNWLQIPA